MRHNHVRYTFYMIAFLVALLFVAIPAHAQEGDLATEIRAALQEQATAEGLSPEEFEALVDSLAEESSEIGVAPERVLESVVVPDVADEGYVFAKDMGESGEEAPRNTYSIALGVSALVVFALVYFIYRKMESGGAISGR